MRTTMQFSDTSNLLNDYELVQANGISMLKKKDNFETAKEPVYKNNLEWGHSYEPEFEAFYTEIIAVWGDTFEQLLELEKELSGNVHLNLIIKPITKRAFKNTLALLVMLFYEDKSFPSPAIISSGDGGIDVEWETDTKMVSIHIDYKSHKRDMIFYKTPDGFKSESLTIKNVFDLLRD